MKTIQIELKLEKETKGTFKYQEVADVNPPALKNLYILKYAVGKVPPEKIKVTISEVE